jgi:GH15 family glucan-1,4-alpha-glucosidase
VARYPNIADHGLIGDLQTAALVTTDGVLDWFCCPRFDSPSVFASLLDAERGGFYRIAPDRDDYVTRQLYLPDTAVLITRFMTPDGVGEVHDFMPVVEGPATNRHRLVRNIRVVRGVRNPGSRWSATVTGCGGPGPCGRASPGEWSWSRWAARPGSCPPRRRSG